MPTNSTLPDYDDTSASPTSPIELLDGGLNAPLLSRRETLDLKAKRDGIPMNLTTYDSKGNQVVVMSLPTEIERCPICRRNQPKSNLPFHMAYQHR